MPPRDLDARTLTGCRMATPPRCQGMQSLLWKVLAAVVCAANAARLVFGESNKQSLCLEP
jgi:hypothetical protein